MGSAALYHLARRGQRVLGLERFDVLHEHGSSHGYTRIIRLAYFEHPDYVPLVRRAYELWRELEEEAGEQLLTITGIVEGGEQIRGRPAGLRRSRPPSTRCSPAPRSDGAFRLPAAAATRGRATRRTGASSSPSAASSRTSRARWAAAPSCARASACSSGRRPERRSRAHRSRRRRGRPARAHRRRVVAGRCAPPGRARPRRSAGARLAPADAAGALRARAHARVQPRARRRALLRLPDPRHPRVQARPLRALQGESGDPDAISREPTLADEAPLRAFAERYFPDGAGPTVALKTCLFEPSPDEHFIIDRHPDAPVAVVAAGFSGHGFKFCSVVGEILADLAIDGSTRHDIDLFRLDRF